MTMATTKHPTLKRAIQPMPASVRAALVKRGLMEAYKARPPYQQNDYLGWIARARLEATRQKRLDQMLDELDGGTKYMNMAWSGGRK
ncbi:YdeI/OmpD-associated family protein [Myxococcus sp. SDU36]|nr:YdeI/OmpD-associated family protein [Myxococcus sp. SDU36]